LDQFLHAKLTANFFLINKMTVTMKCRLGENAGFYHVET